MNIEQIRDSLVAVFQSLSAVEVRGFQNICNMAGSMQVLKDVLDALHDNPREPTEEE